MARKALANATSIDFNIIIELHEGGTTTSISNMICTLAGSRSSKVAELLHVILVAFQILANDQIFDSLANHSRIGLEQRVLQITVTIMCMSHSGTRDESSREKCRLTNWLITSSTSWLCIITAHLHRPHNCGFDGMLAIFVHYALSFAAVFSFHLICLDHWELDLCFPVEGAKMSVQQGSVCKANHPFRVKVNELVIHELGGNKLWPTCP